MRRTLSAVTLVTACLAAQAVVGVGTSHAAPPNGCPYPPNRPVLSAQASRSQVAGTQAFSIGGYHTQNSCGIGNRRVGLFAREGSSGPFTYLQQTTTGTFGQYRFTYATDESLDFLVVFSGDRAFPRTVSNMFRVVVS